MAFVVSATALATTGCSSYDKDTVAEQVVSQVSHSGNAKRLKTNTTRIITHKVTHKVIHGVSEKIDSSMGDLSDLF